jgi:hypothetical protein
VGAIVDREFGKLSCGRPLSAATAAAWRRTVGERVASRALPIRQRGDTLIVRVATSTWLSELQMLAPTIVERLRTEAGCGRIKSLRFEVGALPGRSRPRDAGDSGPVEPPKDLPEPVADALEALEDTALKERIVRTLAATRSSRPR